VRTRHLSLVTHEHSDTVSERSDALSPYGPVRAGLTTSQTIQNQQLSELLNSLESVVENLNYKSFTAYDTLATAIEAVRVALLPTQIDEAGTDVLE
jgi:glutathionyl-hydroquinone reductase